MAITLGYRWGGSVVDTTKTNMAMADQTTIQVRDEETEGLGNHPAPVAKYER
jgi:hypothetical protein